MPKGWAAAVDPSSGQTYYYNEATQVTQWHFPGEEERKIIYVTVRCTDEPEKHIMAKNALASICVTDKLNP